MAEELSLVIKNPNEGEFLKHINGTKSSSWSVLLR